MKKRILAAFLILVLSATLSFQVMAASTDPATVEEDDGVTVIYHDNNTHTIIYPVREIAVPQTAATGDTGTRVGSSEAVNRKNSDGSINWTYLLYGEFSYVEGVSSTCTLAEYTYTVYNDDWRFSDGDAYESGNGAFGVGRFERYIWFVSMEKLLIDFSIYCDVYGNLYA